MIPRSQEELDQISALHATTSLQQDQLVLLGLQKNTDGTWTADDPGFDLSSAFPNWDSTYIGSDDHTIALMNPANGYAWTALSQDAWNALSSQNVGAMVTIICTPSVNPGSNKT